MRLGHFFKRRAIKATRFDDLVQDKNLHILDVGCGNGKVLCELKERGFKHLFGVEPDRELIKNIPSDITVLPKPAEDLPFEDGSMDVIFIYGVLHHLKGEEAWEQSFSEIDRVLKDGGLLFIIEPASSLVYRLMAWSSRLAGVLYRPWGAVAKAIEIERNELFPFMRNFRTYRGYVYSASYDILVDRHSLFVSPIVQWMLSAQKQGG